jgi:hypothetical protein
MKQTVLQFKVPRIKRRCVELYSHDTPFKPKVVESKRGYQRKPKHSKSFNQDF